MAGVSSGPRQSERIDMDTNETSARRAAARAHALMAEIGHRPPSGLVASTEIEREVFARQSVADARENGLDVAPERRTAFVLSVESARVLAAGDAEMAGKLLRLAERELEGRS